MKQHPTKKFLTTINPICVIDRLNDVFGLGGWEFSHHVVSDDEKMVVVKGRLRIPEINVDHTNYGGNDNPDRGDAYKGAATDALTKCASWIGIGAHVWRNGVSLDKSNGIANPSGCVQDRIGLDRTGSSNNIISAREDEEAVFKRRIKVITDFDGRVKDKKCEDADHGKVKMPIKRWAGKTLEDIDDASLQFLYENRTHLDSRPHFQHSLECYFEGGSDD